MKKCPSCGTSLPDSATECPSCERVLQEDLQKGRTLMGIPSEDVERPEESEGEHLGADESTAPEDADSGESGQDGGSGGRTRSTQFGLPAVEREEGELGEPSSEEVDDPEASSETGKMSASSWEKAVEPDETGKTGDWSGWQDELGDEPSKESVLAAWGLSSDSSQPAESEAGEVGDESTEPSSELDAVDAEASRYQQSEPRYRTQMGMPQVEQEDAEAESAPGSEFSSGGTEGGQPQDDDEPTREFDIGSLEDLEQQVRQLEEESEDASGTSETSTLGQKSAVIRKNRSSESEETGSEPKSREGRNTLQGTGSASGGPGLYSSSDVSEAEESSDIEISGRRETKPGLDRSAESGGEGDQGGDSSERSQRTTMPGLLGGNTYIHSGGKREEDEEASSGGSPEAPTGFEVDDQDDEISLSEDVADAPLGGRLNEQDEAVEEPETTKTYDPDDLDFDDVELAEKDEERPSFGDEETGGGEESEPFTAIEEAGDDSFSDNLEEVDFEPAEDDDFDFFEPDAEGAPVVDEASGGGASGVEPGDSEEPEAVEGQTDEEEREEESDVEPTETALIPGDRDEPPEEVADTQGEEPEEEGRESTNRARPTAPVPAPSVGAESSEYAMLAQTVVGLIGGITLGIFVALQAVTSGLGGGSVLLLALVSGSGLGAVSSFVLPFLPLDAQVRSAGYLGLGTLVSALAVSSIVLVHGGLAVGPLVALTGGIFMLGAGLSHRVLANRE